MQCMIFLSSDPNAELVEIEYFIDKKLARTNVTLEVYGSAGFRNISPVIKATSTVTPIMSIEAPSNTIGETRGRLASFQFPCVQAARNLSEGLGWRERPKSCGRGVAQAMRFPSVTASCAKVADVMGLWLNEALQPTPWNADAFQALLPGAADLVSFGVGANCR
ncbi:MAG: hypothetical protein ACREXW_16510 [Gammaproteobacteria bacterium]